ncbi:FHA domain-containing protein [Butyricicoccus pullicaecorum]|uniref:FHA domain-containing protein n=1 Tax=Butyricicoccus pullicaecorum 1.2 TaxID=1203606 RepID=R8VTJ9_9FIRM|nr:FHA domain-containing protein [Butyricicoccus pullicaecorum]EOQ35581.1 hypothetical protein HMPREF1526_03048 [Butyricicoccus pullicaecorum 1.2]SKA67406.1 FHA domain-containing protein [Butyricicoccus pullicaecorum DSM 23266]
MLILLCALIACLIFRRQLMHILDTLPERAAAWKERLSALCAPLVDVVRKEYVRPDRGVTRPTNPTATRPAALHPPQLKYIPADDPQAAPVCVPVLSLPFSIGRAHGCDLSIDDQTLSHTHFEVFACGDNYGVRNLSKTNGIVLVNEQTQRIGACLRESGQVQMIDPAYGYLRFWAGGQFFQLTLVDSSAPPIL